MPYEPTMPSSFATSPFSTRWSKEARSSCLSSVTPRGCTLHCGGFLWVVEFGAGVQRSAGRSVSQPVSRVPLAWIRVRRRAVLSAPKLPVVAVGPVTRTMGSRPPGPPGSLRADLLFCSQ
jgi:hypothetical protein